jgi:hypothetical protein
MIRLNISTTLAASGMMLLCLAACTPGTQGYNRIMEGNGNLRVQPATSPTHDYDVYVRNVLDIGYDPSDKATRDRTALSMLSTQCPSATVVGETTINTGEWLGGRQSMTYIVQVKC